MGEMLCLSKIAGKYFLIVATSFSLISGTQNVLAESVNIRFTGTVTKQCYITVDSNGRLGENDSRTKLASELPNGESMKATLRCNAPTQIEISEPILSSEQDLNNPISISNLVINGCRTQQGMGSPVFAGNSASGYKSVANSGDFGWTPEQVSKCSNLIVNMSITNGGGEMLPMGNYAFDVRISTVSP
ncbi:MAG: hypothetical protein Kow0091_33020 [Geminocystis sp.]